MDLLTAAQKMVEGEQIRRAFKSLALQKDGSITLKDAHGNNLSDDLIRLIKRQYRDMITNWLQDKANEKNDEITSLI